MLFKDVPITANCPYIIYMYNYTMGEFTMCLYFCKNVCIVMYLGNSGMSLFLRFQGWQVCVPLRTRRALLLYKAYGDSALLALS